MRLGWLTFLCLCSACGDDDAGAHADHDSGTPDANSEDARAAEDAGPSTIPNPAIVVANGGSSSVMVIDPETLDVVAELPVASGYHPHHVGLSPDGSRVLISATTTDLSEGHGGGHTGHGSDASTKIYALDVASGSLDSILDVDATAHNAAFSSDGATIYLAMYEHGMVVGYDAATLEATFDVRGFSMPLEVTPTASGSLLVAESGSGEIAVLDIASRMVSERFTTGGVPIAAWHSFGSSYFVSVEEAGEVRHLVDEAAITMDTHTIDVDGQPGQAVVSPDESELWVAVEDRAVVAVYDADSHMLIGDIALGTKPHGVAFEPSGERVFITDETGGRLFVVDREDRTVLEEIDLGGRPNGIVWVAR